MSSITDLFWFDNLARREIDEVLGLIACQDRERDAQYLIEQSKDFSQGRMRCQLKITNRDPSKSLFSGCFTIVESSDRSVRVEHSIRWTNEGKPIHTKTLKEADVTKAEVERLARKFLADFFQRATQE